MTETNSLPRLLLPVLLLLGFPPPLRTQSASLVERGKAAQAKSEDEFDRYLEIVTAPDPHRAVASVTAFVAQFPQSELLAAAYQQEMHAFERLDDFDGLVAAGRAALERNPDDTNTLLTLAAAMASRASGRPDRDVLLSQAEVDAHRALELIDSRRLSRQVSQQDWRVQKSQMEAEAHGVLGVVALQRKQTAIAIREFKTSIAKVSQPQGIQFLRLGLALGLSGVKNEAADNFRRAEELGPDSVRNAAARELKRLSGPVSPPAGFPPQK